LAEFIPIVYARTAEERERDSVAPGEKELAMVKDFR
jgi:hypothetical protein